MRPGHIRVFDGLRITTEHMEHLQGSLHSAMQDIREILGLGKVYHGFKVVAEGEGAITIQPGLAFDSKKNRIVCDDPRKLEVAFGPEEKIKYACIKYDQIENGQVEGRPTIVWDSCSALLRTTLPEPSENLLPIAKLIKSAEGETFEIISLIPSPQVEKPESETIRSRPVRLQIQQNVLRLTADNGMVNYPGTLLIEALKKRLSGAGPSNGELLITIAEKEIGLTFPVSGLTCQTIITGAFSIAEGFTATESPTTVERQPQYRNVKFQSTAQGEVTFLDGELSQFGLSRIQTHWNSGSGVNSFAISELTEHGIAHLPFCHLWKFLDGGDVDNARNSLQPLQLLISVEGRDGPGFKVVCNLFWKGAVSDEALRVIEEKGAGFTWEVLVAWKALGETE
jgi:hypothetical protein